MYGLLRYIPKNHLSYLLGRLSSIRLPAPFSTWLVRLFAYLAGIDREEAALPVAAYRSINDFFVRELKPGLRPIAEGLISPIDGTLRSCGDISNGRIEQIKGIDYSLSELLQDGSAAEEFKDGFYFNLYLSPKDYHHVHFPSAGRVERCHYIPGKLWPVNDWSMKNIPGLFTVNERVITYLKSEFGKIAVVMVGATNVGRMSIAYDRDITLYRKSFFCSVKGADSSYEPSIAAAKGDKLGTFHLGSTVVLLLNREIAGKIERTDLVRAPSAVRLGQKLAHF